jgi:hypothetical protein
VAIDQVEVEGELERLLDRQMTQLAKETFEFGRLVSYLV